MGTKEDIVLQAKTMKVHKDVAAAIDALATLPAPKYRLKHNPKCTPKQKRVIRKAFNTIQPDFDAYLATVIIGGIDRKMT